MIGAGVALLGIGSVYARVELGWHWIFIPIGVLVIFGGGIIDGWRRRDREGN